MLTNLGLVTPIGGAIIESQVPLKEIKLARPAIEPRSIAWKAAMLATTPPTFLFEMIDNGGLRCEFLNRHRQTDTHTHNLLLEIT